MPSTTGRMLRALAIVLVCAAGLAVGVLIYRVQADARGDDSPGTQNSVTPAELAAFDAFPVLWLGEEFEGLELNTILRNPSGFTLIYGDCDIDPGDGSCPAPFQVSARSPCAPSLGGSADAQIRGVAVRRTLDGHLEVDAGSTRVILISNVGTATEQDEQVLRAADMLTTANSLVTVRPGDDLRILRDVAASC